MIEGLENITEAFSLNADNARFSLSRTGLLYLSVPALSFEGRAFLSLAFPFETCEEYICVQNEEKEEIGMIRRFHGLAPRRCDWVCSEISLNQGRAKGASQPLEAE